MLFLPGTALTLGSASGYIAVGIELAVSSYLIGFYMED
jgi:hypothetical protein